MNIGPSAAHVAVALLALGVGAGLWMAGLRGPHCQGALLAVAWAWSRELAQKWRAPGKPGPALTMDNVRQAGWPSLAALAVAIGVEAWR
jgi:hypothetical protein